MGGNEASEESGDARRWAAVEEATELIHEQRFREALVELRRILSEDAHNAYAYHYLGKAFAETGEIEAARDAYVAALKLAPRHLGARVALSHVLRMVGDFRGSVREAMAALSQAPGDGDALFALGLAHHARGEDGAAIAALEAFLETRPDVLPAAQARSLLASLKPPEESDD
jgi:Flp pilus assembly protein TadD